MLAWPLAELEVLLTPPAAPPAVTLPPAFAVLCAAPACRAQRGGTVLKRHNSHSGLHASYADMICMS